MCPAQGPSRVAELYLEASSLGSLVLVLFHSPPLDTFTSMCAIISVVVMITPQVRNSAQNRDTLGKSLYFPLC